LHQSSPNSRFTGRSLELRTHLLAISSLLHGRQALDGWAVPLLKISSTFMILPDQPAPPCAREAPLCARRQLG
jgi:hypothetical protein